MGTVSDFIKKYGVTMSWKRADNNPFWDISILSNHYTITLECQGRGYTLPYSMSIGIEREPELKDVLECLAYDSANTENYTSFREWARELGYNDDSIRVLNLYSVRQTEGDNLRYLLGDGPYYELLRVTGNK